MYYSININNNFSNNSISTKFINTLKNKTMDNQEQLIIQLIARVVKQISYTIVIATALILITILCNQ